MVLGRESFGAHVALFVPAAGTDGETRQTMLAAESQQEAEAELDGLSEAQLREMLERSDRKTLE